MSENLDCATAGHQRVEATFRVDGNSHVTVAHCERCGIKLGAWQHE